MFKALHHIRDFGVFNNFSGTTISPFTSFNLIYGWNYSGKTTLSRIFRSIEQRQLHPDFKSATFRLDCSDGSQITESFKNVPVVRVFNEDFRSENFRWNDANNIEPILILGEANIANKDALDKCLNDRALLLVAFEGAEKERAEIKAEIAKAETECGKQISRELSIPAFDKRHVQKLVVGLNGVYPQALSSEEFRARRATALSNDKKESLPDIKISLPDFPHLAVRVKGLLLKSVTSSAVIQHLLDHPNVSQWVELGRELHKGKDRCEFCEGNLSESRIRNLNAHFSKEFDILKNEVSELLSEVENIDCSINGALYVKAAFYSDFHDDWSRLSSALSDALGGYNASINEIKSALKMKVDNPFSTEFSIEFTDKTEALRQAIVDFNALISRNNRRSDEFQRSKDAAIDVLKNHYCVDAMRKIDRFKKDSRLSELDAAVNKNVEERAALDVEISRLQALLSEAAKGADRLNETLERFFGKNDIKISVNAEDKYVLLRGLKPAKNLSEGEKTAICFAYFVVKLLENNNKLSDTVVYIDDPISSLDANHLMNVHAFIKDTFYKFDSAANPKHQCLAKQLFISTHNYEFFHLAWEWMSKTKKEQHAAFLTQRTDSNGLFCSNISDCPDSIKTYRSEYLFLFSQLASYIDNPSSDVQVVFNLGNMARRFLEGYFAFKYLNYTAIDDHISELIADTVKAERARKFMHFYSHSLKRAGGLKLPDMSESKAVLEIILDGIREQDPIHYGALQAAR